MTTAPSARRPSAGAVPVCSRHAPRDEPGLVPRSVTATLPVGGWLGGKGPTGRLVQISEITARDDLAAVAGHQFGKDADAEAGSQEPHRAVREHDVGPASVKAVDLAVVRAVHGAGPV